MTEPTPPVDDELEEEKLDPRTREALRKLRAENKSLRSRLRDSEEQIGAQAAREAAHQRAVVAAAATAAGLIDDEDLLSRHDPSEFLDEQLADVMPHKVAAATKALLDEKPYLGRPVGAPPTDRPIEGLRSGARAPEDKTPTPSWYSALHGT
jgi:hypothetical protein